MADQREFVLIGRFDDRITKHLVEINKEFASVGKGLRSLTKEADRFSKSINETANSVRKFSKTMQTVERDGSRAFRSSTNSAVRLQDAVKGVQGSVQDMKAGFLAASQDSSASIRGIADSFQDVIAAAQQAAEAARGIGGDVNVNANVRGGGGYTVRKGVAANLIASGVESLFGAAVRMVTGGMGIAMGKVQEAIEDEMDDIGTSGGIFSLGKVYKMEWADTYKEAVEIQKAMDKRMAVMAAKLPGDTDQFVRNSKQLSDNVMKLTATGGAEFVKVMQGFNSAVKTQKDAFELGTAELAKYATLTDVMNSKSAGGGMPFAQLVETLMSQDKLNPIALKRKYVAIGRNPLLSGAIDRNLEELNKAAADSPARFKAMIKLLKEMYPPEVIRAMTRSVDGAYQGMKSALFGMQEGLFGLKREFEITLAGSKKKIRTSLFEIGRDIFVAFGTVMTPILESLPQVLDPMKQIGESFGKLLTYARNSMVVFERAAKYYEQTFGKDDPTINFRASVKTLGELARWMGGTAKDIEELNQIAGAKNLDVGKAIVKSFSTLMGSKAMEEIGYAIGNSVAKMLGMLVTLAETGKFVDEQGLVGGFVRGWNAAKGGDQIGKMIGAGFQLAWKVISGVVVAGFTNAPVETTMLVGLVTGIIPNLLSRATYGLTLKIVQAVAARITALNIAGYISGAVIPQAVAVATGIGTTVSGWMGTALVAVKAAAAGAAALTSTVVGGFMTFIGGIAATIGTFLGGIGTAIAGLFTKLSGMLAFLANPVGIAVVITAAVGAFVYIFKDQIRGAIEMVAKWIEKNMTGPLKAALIGVTQVWKGIVNLIVGSIDWLIGLVTGDKKRMEAGGKAVSEGVSQFFSGWKAILQNAIGAMLQAGKAVADWAWKALTDAAKAFFSGLAGMVTGALKGLDGLQGNFISTIGGGVMGLARRVFTWLTGIQLPGQPTPTTPTTPNNQQPTPTPQKPQLPLPKPVNDGLNLFNWVKDKVGQPRYDGAGKSMPLLKAIGTEMANKPAGSDLVIANSSETVIPAAGGYGMDKLKEVFGSVATGFKAVNEQYQTLANGVTGLGRETQGQLQGIEQTNANRYRQTTRAISSNHQQTQQELATIAGNIASLGSQVATLSGTLGGFGGFFGSGAGAGGANKVVAVGKMLQAMGLRVAENPAFGDGRVGKHAPGSYHYSGRAIDVTGPAALLDQAYARLKATNPAELLWRTAGHYDHLHVAYALGAGKPAFFSSLKAAQQWEQAQIGDARISSVTTNSREMGAGDVVVNVGGVTVHSGNVTDPKELAYLVATEIGNAVNDAVNASIFV